MKLRRTGEGFSLRTLLETFIVVMLLIALGVSIVSNLGLASAVHGDAARSKASSTTLQTQSAALATLRAQVTGLVQVANNSTAVLARKSPTYQFFVCWAARTGDFEAALPALSKTSSPAQLQAFAQIAATTRSALTYKDQGGCLDRSVPVTVPTPVTIPTH